MQKKSP